MNTETMKAMGEMIKSLSEFVNRQTTMNKTLWTRLLALQEKVEELNKRLEEDNE
jgi:hypothetical protein